MAVTDLAQRRTLSQHRWQVILDRNFPEGAIASWPHADGDPGYPTIYRVPWLEVTGMAGLDPIVVMRPFGDSRVVGPFRLIGHEILRVRPHLLWAVSFQDVKNNPMIWCAGHPAEYSDQVMAERARQQADPFPAETPYWTAAAS